MDGFTLVDGVVALVIIVSAVLAYARGMVREVLAILGWVVAAFGALALAKLVEPWIAEIPYVGPILGESCELRYIAAFAAVFAILLMIVALFTPLFSGLVRNSVLGGLDQALGFFFGALRGILLVAVALLVYQAAAPNGAVAIVDGSASLGIFSRVASGLMALLPDNAADWVVAQYQGLTSSCVR